MIQPSDRRLHDCLSHSPIVTRAVQYRIMRDNTGSNPMIVRNSATRMLCPLDATTSSFQLNLQNLRECQCSTRNVFTPVVAFGTSRYSNIKNWLLLIPKSFLVNYNMMLDSLHSSISNPLDCECPGMSKFGTNPKYFKDEFFSKVRIINHGNNSGYTRLHKYFE
ncbi:hypothetical protein CEXT_723051 [Caerostris extrusa]|uniref:Uncharacterized protein n=1 Tax=Caerostris extrusa TaxID=172846 RepID=A0AAV4S139_CAEEX|nr:hypothetical protein CEXT_723051 [Caerostris extrusa]